MSWLLSLYRSQITKKAVMAVTGIILFGFVFVHMLGNTKLYLPDHEVPPKLEHHFEGQETAPAIDLYAAGLRVIGVPLLPEMTIVWATRIGLLVALLLHIWSAAALTGTNMSARKRGYKKRRSIATTYAARTMRWSGVIIFLYVIYHLLHLTVGSAHPDFEHGKVFNNVVIAFKQWPVSVTYVIANLLLGFHLYHGLWSMFQSLGLNHPRFNHWRNGFAAAFAVLITLVNVSFPLSVLFGWVGR